MPARIGRTKRSEKGLLTPDNCVVALIDHQPQMIFGVANFDRQSIINNTVALAKATRVFEVPVVLTSVETKSFSGNLWPQILAVFPEQPASAPCAACCATRNSPAIAHRTSGSSSTVAS